LNQEDLLIIEVTKLQDNKHAVSRILYINYKSEINLDIISEEILFIRELFILDLELKNISNNIIVVEIAL